MLQRCVYYIGKKKINEIKMIVYKRMSDGQTEGMIELDQHSITPIVIMTQARILKKYKNHWKKGIGKHIHIISKYLPTNY